MCDCEASLKYYMNIRKWYYMAERYGEKVSEWEKLNYFMEPSSEHFIVMSKFLCCAPTEIDGKITTVIRKAIQRVRVPLLRYLLKCIEHSTLMDLILVRINLRRKISENP